MVQTNNKIKDTSGLSNDEKKAIWEKANLITGYEPNKWRRDNYGNEIKWDDYDNRKSNYGWEIAHINLISNSINDNASRNLEPLHWKNNATSIKNI